MDYQALRNEILADPATLGYAGKTDQEITDLLNSLATGRTVQRTNVAIKEVYAAIDDGAWPSTAILQDKLRGLLQQPYIDATNTNTRGIIGVIFPNAGGTANTRTRLLALQTKPASRAEEIGLGQVYVGQVNLARTKSGGW